MSLQYEDEKGEKIWEWNGLSGQQMFQFECPRHWNRFVSSNFGVGWIPLLHYWPSRVIRNGSPVWRWKRWKNLRAKWAEWPANGPVWMHQALKSICFIQFWDRVNSTSPLLALWGNKKWLPIMKIIRWKKFENGLNGQQMVKFECTRHWNFTWISHRVPPPENGSIAERNIFLLLSKPPNSEKEHLKARKGFQNFQSSTQVGSGSEVKRD